MMNHSTPMQYHQGMKMKRNYMFKWSGGGPGQNKKLSFARIHDAPKHRRDMYFALDAEMVGIGPEGRESALARVSIVNWENGIVFHSYVKVEAPVTDYRSFVSGIQPEQIKADSAMSLLEVRQIISSILHGKILIGHGLEHDLKIIGIQHPWCDIRDTATYEPFMRVKTNIINNQQQTSVLLPRKLKCLAWERLGKEIQIYGKPHSPIEDAIAAMDLYKSVRNDWEDAIARKLNVSPAKYDEFFKRSVPAISMPVGVGDAVPVPMQSSQQVLQQEQVMQLNKRHHNSYYDPNIIVQKPNHQDLDTSTRSMKPSFPLYHNNNNYWSNENCSFYEDNNNNNPFESNNSMNHQKNINNIRTKPFLQSHSQYQQYSAYYQ